MQRQVAKTGVRAFSSSPKLHSLWSHVEMAPADPILGVSQAFQKCTSPDKLNLGVGAYRDEVSHTPSTSSLAITRPCNHYEVLVA